MDGGPRRRSLRLPLGLYGQRGRTLLVTVATSPRRNVFALDDFGAACEAELRAFARATGTDLLAHCLMPDHVHLVAEVGATPLSAFVGGWKSLCYRQWRRRGHRETFWQRGFVDRFLRSEAQVRRAIWYTLMNPVRSGLVEVWDEYPLSGAAWAIRD
jgi:REP element-mobilizing transposase RayT